MMFFLQIRLAKIQQWGQKQGQSDTRGDSVLLKTSPVVHIFLDGFYISISRPTELVYVNKKGCDFIDFLHVNWF